MKKTLLCLVTITALALLCISYANAFTDLNIDVTATKDKILPGEDEALIATTNEKGTGMMIVIQPAGGSTPSTSFLWWVPEPYKSQIISDIGGKIISYYFPGINKWEKSPPAKTLTFPDDFTGLNGAPNTFIPGKYKVIFVFVSIEGKCWCWDIDFDCDKTWFNVVPEVPLGTIMAIVPLAAAFGTVTIYKRRRHLD